jgi:bifunctional ADP-heptose synthase (sugar kinase/adenylyltransferase)
MKTPNLRVEGLIRRLRPCRVAVIGDVMLDQHVKENADRLSPEAPIQILDMTEEYQMPGGAANVVTKAIGLGAQARLVGLIGTNVAASELRNLLAQQRQLSDGLIVDPGRATPGKTRFLAHNQ